MGEVGWKQSKNLGIKESNFMGIELLGCAVEERDGSILAAIWRLDLNWTVYKDSVPTAQ